MLFFEMFKTKLYMELGKKAIVHMPKNELYECLDEDGNIMEEKFRFVITERRTPLIIPEKIFNERFKHVTQTTIKRILPLRLYRKYIMPNPIKVKASTLIIPNKLYRHKKTYEIVTLITKQDTEVKEKPLIYIDENLKFVRTTKKEFFEDFNKISVEDTIFTLQNPIRLVREKEKKKSRVSEIRYLFNGKEEKPIVVETMEKIKKSAKENNTSFVDSMTANLLKGLQLYIKKNDLDVKIDENTPDDEFIDILTFVQKKLKQNKTNTILILLRNVFNLPNKPV